MHTSEGVSDETIATPCICHWLSPYPLQKKKNAMDLGDVSYKIIHPQNSCKNVVFKPWVKSKMVAKKWLQWC